MWYEQIKWVLLLEVAYVFLVLLTGILVIWDTRSSTKTLGYLLLIFFLPVLGILFYFTFGINYRKRKIYTSKLQLDEELRKELQEGELKLLEYLQSQKQEELIHNRELAHLMANKKTAKALVFPGNEATILKNGEELFPLLFEEIKKAKHHIHLEYYIYDDDITGNLLKDILMEKAREGVEVRLIYDDFGSRSIRKKLIKELKSSGVQAHPFNKIKLLALANKINYRNHRKIVIIDGIVSFTGGINISDKYDNTRNDSYWRDTHMMIKGPATLALQETFIADWNFCSQENLVVSRPYFPLQLSSGNAHIQVISSGPDSDLPNILFAVIQAINLARYEILLTTPYYIPDDTLQESLIIAALSGVQVHLLIPAEGDSLWVSIAGESYFEELLHAGVKIYRYKKGFVHAKTFVTDRQLASVGTANLDLRSFDLNFEVSTLIYDAEIANQMAETFFEDLKDAERIDPEKWENRPLWRRMAEQVIRLTSPFM
jgi:cardiolipin synthase